MVEELISEVLVEMNTTRPRESKDIRAESAVAGRKLARAGKTSRKNGDLDDALEKFYGARSKFKQADMADKESEVMQQIDAVLKERTKRDGEPVEDLSLRELHAERMAIAADEARVFMEEGDAAFKASDFQDPQLLSQAMEKYCR